MKYSQRFETGGYFTFRISLQSGSCNQEFSGYFSPLFWKVNGSWWVGWRWRFGTGKAWWLMEVFMFVLSEFLNFENPDKRESMAIFNSWQRLVLRISKGYISMGVLSYSKLYFTLLRRKKIKTCYKCYREPSEFPVVWIIYTGSAFWEGEALSPKWRFMLWKLYS